MIRTLAGLIAGLIIGGAGAAVAAEAMTPPPNPDWMTRPCATPTQFHIGNCYWDPATMGDGTGPAAHFAHTFHVYDGANDRRIRCYFYSTPTSSTEDHCYALRQTPIRVAPVWPGGR